MLALMLALSTALRIPLLPSRPATLREPMMLLGMGGKTAEGPPRTVGEAKDAFQEAYKAPVGSVAQSFVNEMITSVTLATGMPSYKYTRVFAVGYEALCDSFLTVIENDKQRENIKECMYIALELDGKQLKKDADDLKALCAGKTEDELLATPDFVEIAQGHKYSYPFGAGLLTLMPLVDAAPTPEVIDRWCGTLNLTPTRLQKDWVFFEKALQQMADGKQMMMEMKASAKRKEAAALKAKADAAAAEAAAEETVVEETPPPAPA